MGKASRALVNLLLTLILPFLTLGNDASPDITVSFINFSDKVIDLYWSDETTQSEQFVDHLEPYLEVHHNTVVGHTFVYYLDGQRYSLMLEEHNELHALGPDDKVHVSCTTSTGDLAIVVKPQWSPLGAARFLELVQRRYFDGCALNRVVEGFLTQFGIGANYAVRTEYREKTIIDDVQLGIPFQPGFMSYAGSGEDSRSNEIFIVMPNTSENQLNYFGKENPWETPFGFVEPESLETVEKWYEYGDMPPWGAGPDPQRIYLEDGYDYLKREFPNLSYIHECRILSFVKNDKDEETEL